MKAMGPEVLNQPFNIAFFGMVDASKGRRAGGRAALDQLEKMRATQYVDGAFGVGLCEALGDQKARAQWLQRMQDNEDSASRTIAERLRLPRRASFSTSERIFGGNETDKFSFGIGMFLCLGP